MSKLAISPAGSVPEQAIATAVMQYRTLVAQRYTPCPPTDIQRLLSTAPYTTSRKIDGELWFIDTTGSSPRLIAPNGRVATGSKILEVAASFPKDHIIAATVGQGIFTPHNFTVAQLTEGITGQVNGSITFCANESGGAVPVFYDGTNWRRMTDRAIIT